MVRLSDCLKPAVAVDQFARERLMVDYGRTPVIDEGIAVDLAKTSDEELEELIRHAQDKVFNTDVAACWEAAALFLAMFHCKRCGQCCQGTIFAEPVLRLVPGEPRVIADYLGQSSKWLRQFCTHRGSTLYLKLPCPFYREGTCSIYEVRPMSCRLYPLQGAIKIKENGNIQEPTFVLDIDCPAGNDLAIRLAKLRKAICQGS